MTGLLILLPVAGTLLASTLSVPYNDREQVFCAGMLGFLASIPVVIAIRLIAG